MPFSLCRSLVSCVALLLMSTVALAEDKPATEPKPAPAANAPTDLSGQWSGTWLSHSNGHDGPITGNFRKIDDDHYCVHFTGRFWGLFPFDYDVVMTVTERKADQLTMSGASNLGFLFGTFTYTATVTDTCFVASYCSKHDHGVFNMTRCCRCQR